MVSINTPAAAQLKLKARKTKDLIRDFILSGIMYDSEKNVEKRMNLATVRGWMMDEIESRNPEAFDAWIESNTDDDGLLAYFN